jgi:hypothetical protein
VRHLQIQQVGSEGQSIFFNKVVTICCLFAKSALDEIGPRSLSRKRTRRSEQPKGAGPQSMLR